MYNNNYFMSVKSQKINMDFKDITYSTVGTLLPPHDYVSHAKVFSKNVVHALLYDCSINQLIKAYQSFHALFHHGYAPLIRTAKYEGVRDIGGQTNYQTPRAPSVQPSELHPCSHNKK